MSSQGARQHSRRTKRRRPPDFRHVAIDRAVRDDMPKRRKIEVDSGDAEFLSGNEFEHLFSLLRCGGRIDVVGDARVGEGELHSWKMDDVAPDEKPSPPESTSHAVWPEYGRVWGKRGRRGRPRRSSPYECDRYRRRARASEVEIALALRWHTRHRPVVFPVGKLVLMQDELRLREYSLSGCVDKPRLVIRCICVITIVSMSAGATSMAFRFSARRPTCSVFRAYPASTSTVGRRYGSRSS